MFINSISFLLSGYITTIFGANNDGNPNPNSNIQTSAEAEAKLTALELKVQQLRDKIDDQFKQPICVPFCAVTFMKVFELQAQVNAIKEKGPWTDFFDEDSTARKIEKILLDLFKKLNVDYYKFFLNKYK